MAAAAASTAASTMAMFIPIAKIDEEKRLIYGTMTAEAVDRAGEILDYAASKPHFQKWSDTQNKASRGLSKGNLRVMHDKKVAGKLTELVFNDDVKNIGYVAKVTDDNEWEKVLDGSYTGVSIGGKYASRVWDSVVKAHRYVAMPGELSLVDVPCLPGATFDVMKADGSVLQKRFQKEMSDEDLAALAKRHADAVSAEEGAEGGEDAGAGGEEGGIQKAAGVETDFVPDNGAIAARAVELAKAAGKGATWTTFIPDAVEALKAEHVALEKAAAGAEGDAGGDAGADKGDANAGADGAANASGEGAGGDVNKAAGASDDLEGLEPGFQTADGKFHKTAADARAHMDALKKVAAPDPIAEALAKCNAAFNVQPAGEGEDQTVYADPLNKRFPLGDSKQIQAAWFDLAKADYADYSGDQIEAMQGAVRSAWADEFGEDQSPPDIAKLAIAFDPAFGAALELLQKRFLNDEGLCAPSSYSSQQNFYTMNRMADAVQTTIGVVRDIDAADRNEQPLGELLDHARAALASMAILYADAAHVQVSSLLEELGVPDPDDDEDEAVAEKAHAILDLAKVSDIVAMRDLAEQEVANQSAEFYKAAWTEFYGAEPPADDVNVDMAMYAAALTKLADRCGAPVLAGGVNMVARIAAAVSSFEPLVKAFEDSDDATLQPQLAGDLLKSIGHILTAAAHEEIGEMLPEIEAGEFVKLADNAHESEKEIDAEITKLAADILDLASSDEDMLEKIGARNSRSDTTMIQKIHDYASSLGAGCSAEKCAKAEGEGDPLGKVDVVNADLQKRCDELQKQVAQAVDGFGELQKKISDQAAMIAKLQAEPAPAPSKLDVLTLHKGNPPAEQNGAISPDVKAIVERLSKLSPDDQVVELLKLSQSQPKDFITTGF